MRRNDVEGVALLVFLVALGASCALGVTWLATGLDGIGVAALACMAVTVCAITAGEASK